MIASLSAANIGAIALLAVLVVGCAIPLGRYIAGVFGDPEPAADGSPGRRPGDRARSDRTCHLPRLPDRPVL